VPTSVADKDVNEEIDDSYESAATTATSLDVEQDKGKKLTDLKNESFVSIQKMFNKAFKRVNTIVDYKTELVKESSKKAEEEVTKRSSKRVGTELE
nr:hypothetical protein [Tanacetum cinerariifolium]